jgi:gliding motility-associated-like protein
LIYFEIACSKFHKYKNMSKLLNYSLLFFSLFLAFSSTFACGTCSSPTCLIAGPYSDYSNASLFSNHCSQMNDLSASPITSSTYISYHSIVSSSNGSLGMVISVQEGGPTNPCGVNKTAKLYPAGSSCSVSNAISPTTTNANGSSFYNPEWTGLNSNANYIVEIIFTIPLGCSLIDHCESYYYPSSSSCTADVGSVNISGGVAVGLNEYDLSNCQTITFNASNEDLNGGLLTYGWAVFSCDPSLPFTSAQISDFTNHPCYLGSDYGLSTSDQDAGGISGTVPGGYNTLWILPYTSDIANSLDGDGDGCYDFGDVIKVNYLAPICGDCSSPNCVAGGVSEFIDRTYLLCNDPCADLNDLTHITYHTVTADNFGNIGVVQQLSFNQFGCSGLSRSGVLREVANSCSGPDITPNILNANGVGSGFNPEWYGLIPNTNYTMILTTVIGSNCYYDFGCVDFYGIPTCNTILGDPYTSTICPSGSVLFNGTTYDANNLTGSETFTAANGCDSIVAVTITIQQAIIGTPYTSTICPSGSVLFNGTTYDANNLTGSETFTAANGCDSTVAVTITIQQAIVGTPYTSTICPSGSVLFNGTNYDANNLTGSETFTAANGCDSIVAVTITIQQAIIGTPYTSTICPSGSVLFNGTTYDANNLTGSETFTAANGCDSIVAVTITIQQAVYGSYLGSICENDTIIYNGNNYNANNLSGSDTLVSSDGCDSIVNISFSLFLNFAEDVNASICSGESFEYSGVVYDSSNLSADYVFQTVNGCDSIISVNVIQYPNYSSVFDTTIYGLNSLDYNGFSYNNDNPSSSELFTSSDGCDSSVTVNVVFENESIFFIPDGFSPNSDGNNDYLYVMGGGLQDVVFRVFNRWGQLVFETDCCCNQECGWDGRLNGYSLNNGTYVYFFKALDSNGDKISSKGTISLIK